MNRNKYYILKIETLEKGTFAHQNFFYDSYKTVFYKFLNYYLDKSKDTDIYKLWKIARKGNNFFEFHIEYNNGNQFHVEINHIYIEKFSKSFDIIKSDEEYKNILNCYEDFTKRF